MTGTDARVMLEHFLSSYDGSLAAFVMDGGCDEKQASASCPDGDSTSIVRIEVVDDIQTEFDNRRRFIMSKRKRLGPMGKLEEFSCPAGFDESYGGILNFKLLGKVGGFFFYTGRTGNVLVFLQVYSTSGKGQIPDADRDYLIIAVSDSVRAL